MKSTLFVTVVIAGAVVASTTEDVETAWNKFKLDYEKEYSDQYEDIRKTIFTDNFNKIAEHNKLYDQGLVKHSLAINKFADMTNEEFTKIFNGYRSGPTDSSDADGAAFVPNKTKEVPDTVDWREKGAVTPVKDQQMCGSCWAFSSTGALEGQYFMKTGKLISISEQNLIDCSHDGNHGCEGGLMDNAFQYVHKNDGIDSEEAYPYKAHNGKCVYKVSGNVTSTEGFTKIEKGNEEHLKAAIATVGPISVAIDASQKDFMFYSKGIYFNAKCRNSLKSLDHGVLAVGYGSEDGEDYWLIKNSWAVQWGLDGYIKMARNKKNNCGVATAASYPCNYH